MIKLATLFSAHAVLQREMSIPVWGWTEPAETVYLRLEDEEIAVSADERGAFCGHFNARAAGGPLVLRAALASGEQVEVPDIYIGEVWLAGGQSNMEMPLTGFETPLPADDLRQLRFSRPVRLLAMNRSMSQIAGLQQHCDADAEWLLPVDENYSRWSACAAFFAAELVERLQVPCGIISCNLGGTIIETWLSFEKLWHNPEQRSALLAYEKRVRSPDFVRRFLQRRQTEPPVQEDVYGYLIQRVLAEWKIDVDQPSAGRELPDFDDSQWTETELPGIWQKNLKIPEPGIVWYRRTVTIPEPWIGHELQLEIGAADKQDITYFNGVKVGTTGKNFEFSYWNSPRKYAVPASLVCSRRVVIAVRVFSYMFSGGLTGPAEQMLLRCPECSDAALALSGTWRAQMTLSLKEVQIPSMMGYGNPNSFHMLFDSMVRPLVPYAVRGVIWYQGEGNQNNYWQYERLLTDLIEDWRTRWHQAEFTFIQVLLAGWLGEEGESKHWPELRQAQINAARATKTGLVSAVDLGEKMNIHPLWKREVGHRLALRAFADVYGLEPASRSPELRRVSRQGDFLCLELNFAVGLNSRGETPAGFEIAGADEVFHRAEAKICADRLLVKASSKMCQLRYAWHDYPSEANLYNAAGLPLLPFRTEIPG